MKDRIRDTRDVPGAGSGKPRKEDLFETPDLFLGMLVLGPGQAQKSHTHAREDKAYLVLSGRPSIRLGDDETRAEAGQIVLCPKGVPHGTANEGPEDARLLVFMAPHPRPATLTEEGA